MTAADNNGLNNLESRVSYFQVQDEKAKSLNKTSILHRLVAVAEIGENLSEKSSIENFFEETFDKLQKKMQAESSSGILLLYPNHVTIVLESSYDVIVETLRTINSDPTTEDDVSLFEGCRIVTIFHDISSRLFPKWFCRTLNLTPLAQRPEKNVEAEKLAADIITSVVKLALFMMKSAENMQLETFQQLCGQYCPVQLNLTLVLMNRDFMTCEEYLQIFHSPLDVTLDQDVMWPIDNDIVNSACADV